MSVLKLAIAAAELGNLNAISDAGSASALARAGLTGAGYNVRINLLGMPGDQQATAMTTEVGGVEKQADELITRIRQILSSRGGMQL